MSLSQEEENLFMAIMRQDEEAVADLVNLDRKLSREIDPDGILC